MQANCGDNNPSQNPDPMTARTSPTWDNNPNHRPDPMQLYSTLMNLHHTGAYSVAPVDPNAAAMNLHHNEAAEDDVNPTPAPVP
jgi:hypothetical protein